MATATNSLCLRELVVELKDIIDVHTLGVHLGLPHSRLAVIRDNFPNNNDQRKSEILNTWLEDDPGKSWLKLVQALVAMDRKGIAKKIAQKHCPKFIFTDSEQPAIEAQMKIDEANAIITTVKSIADQLQEIESSKQLERISLVVTSGKVQMGLVGLTNSGKSTSLNALMGLDILPSSFQRQTVSSVCIRHVPNSPGELYGRKTTEQDSVLLASGLQPVRKYISQLNDHDRLKENVFYAELVLEASVRCLESKEKVDLEIFDTPGTSEAGSSNVSAVWNTALNNLAAIVLIISADYVFEVSQASLLDKIKALHPHMMEKQNRMLVLINKYDKCFDGNQESWTPAQLREKVASHIKVSPDQIVLFSATSALKARKWMQDPSIVNEDDHGKVYFDLRQTPEKDNVAGLKPYTRENVSKLGEVLERFSRIREVETRLLGKLCVNGPGILLESAVDDSLREVSKLKSATAEKIKAVNIEVKQANVSQQKGLVEKVDQVLETHCKQKINTNLPRMVMQAFEVQLNAIASTFENQIVSGATGKVMSLRGEFTDRSHIHQRVVTVRNDMMRTAEEKVIEAWSSGISEMKVRLTAQLRLLLQELKQDVLTSHLTDYLNFDSANPVALIDGLSFPAVQQAVFSQCQDINDAAMNALVLPRTVTKQRVEQRSKKGGRRYGFAGPKETIHYTEVVNYQVTIYEANIDGLTSAFQRMASFGVTHIRGSLVNALRDLASKLSQVLWGDIQQLSKQPLWKLQHELEARMQALKLGDSEIKALQEKSTALCKAECDLRQLL